MPPTTPTRRTRQERKEPAKMAERMMCVCPICGGKYEERLEITERREGDAVVFTGRVNICACTKLKRHANRNPAHEPEGAANDAR